MAGGSEGGFGHSNAAATARPRHPESKHGELSSPAVPWGPTVHPGPRHTSSRGSSLSLQVARQLQPSVVWIGDTEKTFYKKVPNTERMVRTLRPVLVGAFLSSRGALAGAASAFREGPAFPREEGTEGQPLPPSPGLVCVGRDRWAAFLGHNLEKEGQCRRRRRGAGSPDT